MSLSETAAIDTVAQPPSAADTAQYGARAKRSRRATFIKWLRRVHGWVGLWGASLGLLFGVTGFVLNHRGEPLHVSAGAAQVSTLQLAVPNPAPQTPRELAAWLRTQPELQLPAKMARVQKEPAHPVAWGDRRAEQPEHWQFAFSSAKKSVAVDYWVGNDYVTLKRSENSLLAMLTNLHKGVGMSIGWVLLVDTLAGALVLLSLTGVLLWTELNRRRTIGAVLVIGSIVTAVCVGLA